MRAGRCRVGKVANRAGAIHFLDRAGSEKSHRCAVWRHVGCSVEGRHWRSITKSFLAAQVPTYSPLWLCPGHPGRPPPEHRANPAGFGAGPLSLFCPEGYGITPLLFLSVSSGRKVQSRQQAGFQFEFQWLASMFARSLRFASWAPA